MITCPSCHTRYRHRVERGVPPEIGQCGRCDASFPMVFRAPYRVLARRPAGGRPATVTPLRPAPRMTIGMDDPRLAEQLGRTALDSGDSQPLTYRVVAHTPLGDAGDGRIDLPADEPTGAVSPLPQAALEVRGVEGTEWSVPPSADPPALVEESFEADPVAEASPGPRFRPLREWIGTFMLTSLGVAGGFRAAELTQVAPAVSMAAGGAAGLLLAWSWIRWVARRH